MKNSFDSNRLRMADLKEERQLVHGLRVIMGAWLPTIAQNSVGYSEGILHFMGDRKHNKGQKGMRGKVPRTYVSV